MSRFRTSWKGRQVQATRGDRLKTKFAVLLDHFKQPLSELAKLTDRQIDELYFHTRDEHGSIAVPKEEAPAVPQEVSPDRALRIELAQLQVAAARGLINQDDYARVRQGLIDKYGGNGGE